MLNVKISLIISMKLFFYAGKIETLLESEPFWMRPFLYFTQKKLLKTYFKLVNDLKDLDLKKHREDVLYYDSDRLVDTVKIAQHVYKDHALKDDLDNEDKQLLILSGVLQSLGYRPYSK